jgi:putative membrane protein
MASTFRTLRTSGLAATAALLSLAALAIAQQNPARPNTPLRTQRSAVQQPAQPAAPQRVTANKVATEGAAATDNDRTIATWLAIGNLGEIAISHYAESKVENKDVRKFAEQMVKDHKEMQKQLEQFGASVMAFGEPTNPQRTAAGQVVAERGGLNFLDVERQIAERCVASAEKELSSKDGKERDECFIGIQMGLHKHMIETSKVLREHASPELQAVLDKSIESAESHLDHAKHLIRDLVAEKRDNDRDNKN